MCFTATSGQPEESEASPIGDDGTCHMKFNGALSRRCLLFPVGCVGQMAGNPNANRARPALDLSEDPRYLRSIKSGPLTAAKLVLPPAFFVLRQKAFCPNTITNLDLSIWI